VNKIKSIARAAACTALVLTALQASAAQTVEKSTNYGLLTLPYTQNIGDSLQPMANSGDTFLEDYGFSIGNDGSFSSAVVTFDLNNILGMSGLTVTLLSGTPWSGAVPSDLTDAQIAARDSSIIVSGTGSNMNSVINDMTLTAGNYVVEVSGHVTGTAGGSYGGVFNVAAVPEPAGLALVLAGFGLVALRRRAAR
jgi:hypothetical protein